MTIKQQGGVFGRNPTFNNVTADGTLSAAGTISTTSNMVIEAGSPNIRFMETDTTDQNYRIRGQAGELIFEKIADNNSIVTECFRVDGSNNLALKTGSLVVANGKGIDFSATSGTGTSELFDDYEEGTFTPTVTDGSTEASYGGRLGRYTKIGRAVHIELYFINIDTTGLTAGNSIVVGGLPFSHVTQSFNKAILNVQAHTLASTNGAVSAALASAATTMTLIDGTSTQIKDALTVAALTSGTSDLFISGTYEAA